MMSFLIGCAVMAAILVYNGMQIIYFIRHYLGGK